MQRTFNGITYGDGTVYDLAEEEGLEWISAESGTRSIPRSDGGIRGLHTRPVKQITATIEIATGVATTTEAALEELQKAWVVSPESDSQLVFKDPERTEKFVRGSIIELRPARDHDRNLGFARLNVAWELADPRVYSTERPQELVPVFGASLGGFDLAADLPVDMAEAEQELGTAINEGSTNAYPVVQFQHVSGTVSGVTLTNLTTGVVLDVQTAIVSGQILTADMDALIRATGEPVIAIGTASRYGDWQTPRTPFYLEPGSNSLKFEVTGGGEAVCSVAWFHTF